MTKELAKREGGPKEALETIAKKCPEEANEINSYLEGVKAKDITVLGQDEVFNLRDSSGEIRAVRGKLTLSSANGGLGQPVPNGPYVISAQGYVMWAETAGAIVINAPTVLVDGVQQQNPHIRRDPKNRRILEVYCRAIAFRYSSKGIPQVSDRTTIFDVPAYRMIDLLAKAKKFPHAFRLLPVGMEPPPGETSAKSKGTWAKYDFDEATQLWIDTSHEEALQWFGHIINREKKAIDLAQTFAQRNALKHLSGLQKAPSASWTIAVTCWRPVDGNLIKWDPSRYVHAVNALDRLSHGDQKALDIDRGVEHIEAPEVVEEIAEPEEDSAVDMAPGTPNRGPEEEPPWDEENSSPQTSHGAGEGTPDEQVEEPTEREEPGHRIWLQYDAAVADAPDVHKEAVKMTGIARPMSVEAAKLVLKAMNQIADAQ
jgi:hypothetical protein